MYNQRKKRIIIIVVVMVVLLIALGAGGFFAYAYTDLFKSNETLFYKYASQTLDSLKYVENAQLKDIESLKEENPYEVISNVSYGIESNGQEYDIAKLNMQANINKQNEEAYNKINISSNNQNLFTLEYAHSNNIYALKSDEIVNAFLGIENDNLKVLAKKLGITDTTQIPNKIEPEVQKDISLSNEEIEYIQTTYLEALRNAINKDKYTKEKELTVARDGKSYNSTAYRLKLTLEEIKQIEVGMLTTLLEDSRTLDIIATRAKTLELGEEYTNIDKLSKNIEKLIENINKDTQTGEGITIMIYVNGGKVVTTEIIVRNEIKYTIYGTSTETMSKRYLLIENLSVDAEVGKIEINEQETRAADKSTINISANIDDKTNIAASLMLTGNANTSINTTGEISLDINNEGTEATHNISYDQQLTFKDNTKEIIKLNRSNCGVLNDYDTETLKMLLTQISERIQFVFNEKMRMLTYTPAGTLQQNAQPIQGINTNAASEITAQEKETFNAKFKAYEGKITATNLKALKTLVENSNISNMENQVTLIIDGQRSFGDNVKINENTDYNVQLIYNDEGFINEIIANANS